MIKKIPKIIMMPSKSKGRGGGKNRRGKRGSEGGKRGGGDGGGGGTGGVKLLCVVSESPSK